MILTSSLDLGKTDSLVKLAEDLGGFVFEAVRRGASLDEVERGAFRRVLDMGGRAIKLFLDAQGDGDLGATVSTAEGATLYRSDTPITRTLRTIFGEHSFQAYVYAPGSKQRIELRPIDARLNLPEGKASYLGQKRLPYGNWKNTQLRTADAPLKERFFYKHQGQLLEHHGPASLVGTITVSPDWYIRGGPHTAVSGVGDPRERHAFLRVRPLGTIGVLGS